MSMAQEYTQQHHPYGDPAGSRFHSRQGSASSVLAAATYGAPYNSFATPSPYVNMSWPSANTVSPSIWSLHHQSRVQWPSTSAQDRQNSTYYGNYGNYPFVPRQYGGQVYATQQACLPQQQLPHQQMRQNTDQQQILVVPQLPPHLQQQSQPAPVPQQMNPQLMAAYGPPAALQPAQPIQVPQYSMRAPLQPYQNITSPESGTPPTEYDVTTFSKFLVAVTSGIFMEDLTVAESNELEQFISSLLYATRLPKSTVLLSFFFLNQWPKLKSSHLENATLKSQVVCSLVLANKINDDNTFTNASWGLVTGIPAKEITKLELAWLDALNWQLSVGDNGIAEWNYWHKCWEQYEQAAHSSGMQNSNAVQSTWTSNGFVYEPFSVAVC